MTLKEFKIKLKEMSPEKRAFLMLRIYGDSWKVNMGKVFSGINKQKPGMIKKGLKEISSSASYVYEGTASGQFLATGVATLQKSGTENWNFGTSVTTLTEAQENKLIIVPKQTVVGFSNEGTGTVTSSNTISSVTNIDNYEEGDYIRVANSTANGGIFQIVQKKAARLRLPALSDRNQGNGPLTVHHVLFK